MSEPGLNMASKQYSVHFKMYVIETYLLVNINLVIVYLKRIQFINTFKETVPISYHFHLCI